MKMNESTRIFLSGNPDLDSKVLALDALTSLTREFIRNPDYRNLFKQIILTISGQFTAANIAVRFKSPGQGLSNQNYLALGQFQENLFLASYQIDDENSPFFAEQKESMEIATYLDQQETSLPFHRFSEAGVRYMAPLLQNDNPVAIIYLGDKVTGRPYSDGEIEFFGLFIKTITPLVVNSFLFKEITDLKEWYLEILNNVKQGVFAFDSNYLLKSINRRGYEILCQSRPQVPPIDRLIGTPIQLIFPDDTFWGWANTIFNNRTGDSPGEFKNIKAKFGNDERLFLMVVNQIQRHSRSGGNIIVTLDDITAQREAEGRLIDLEKMAEQGSMVSSIGHELNNYLGIFMGGIEIAEMNLKDARYQEALDSMSRVKKQVSQMERYTAGLMDSSRLETRREPHSLNESIADVLSFAQAQRRFQHIKIVIDQAARLPRIEIDRDQIAQLIMNFMNNASDAIRETGRSDGRIILKTYPYQDKIILVISDNGSGMADEVRQNLFNKRITTKKHGHGYGLMTCKKIIENHDAKIRVDSTVGEGTTFTITFHR